MLICLCVEEKNKAMVIEKLVNVFKDRVVICNYYSIMFNTLLEEENIKYKIIDKSSNLDNAYVMYHNYIDKLVNDKINNYIIKDNNIEMIKKLVRSL